MKNCCCLTIALLVSSSLGCRSAHQNVIPGRYSGVCGVVQKDSARLDRSKSLLDLGQPDRVTDGESNLTTPHSKVVQAAFIKQRAETRDAFSGTLAPNGGANDSNEPIVRVTQNASSMPMNARSMTLEQAEQFAIGNNPDLMKAKAEIESLRGKHLQVGLKPNPQVGYLAADIGEEETAGQQGAFFSQTFIRGGKLSLNRAIVCQEIEAARYQLEVDQQRLLTDVRQRFFDLLVAQERVSTTQTFASLSRKAAEISDKLLEAEEISKIANLRTKLQVKNISVISEQADNNLSAATRRLAATIGLGQPDQTETGSVSAIGEATANISSIDPRTLFETILANSPEIAVAQSELEVAKWNLNRQIAEPTRDVQVQTSFTHSNVTSDDLVGLQVGVPLRINDRNQGNISSARSQVAKSLQNIVSIKRDLSKRFSVAWRDYENARIQTERYQNDIIPAASEFYELVQDAYKAGELEYLDLVSAQQAYLDASLKSLDALQSFWRAAALIDGNLLSAN